MKTPFKTKGIYARKINPEKEFINYKPTKLGNMWKVAIGEKEEPIYEIIWFSEKYSISINDNEEKQYCADYSKMIGEILGLADWHKKRSCRHAEYIDVFIDEKYFEFGDDDLLFSGNISDDILYLTITNIKTEEFVSEILRYIPWI